MDEKQIDDLLKDVKTDKKRVKESIFAILQRYELKPEEVVICRKKLDPSQIFVAATEECSLRDAKEIMNEKYQNILPAPITVLRCKKKYALFIGSNRSIVFVLKGKKPDCIVVEIPDTTKSITISEAKQTLKQIIDKQIAAATSPLQ